MNRVAFKRWVCRYILHNQPSLFMGLGFSQFYGLTRFMTMTYSYRDISIFGTSIPQVFSQLTLSATKCSMTSLSWRNSLSCTKTGKKSQVGAGSHPLTQVWKTTVHPWLVAWPTERGTEAHPQRSLPPNLAAKQAKSHRDGGGDMLGSKSRVRINWINETRDTVESTEELL